VNKVQLSELEQLIDSAIGEGARITTERQPDGTINVLVRFGSGAVSVQFQRDHLEAFELEDLANIVGTMVGRFG
jgi:hypothetical protein